MKEGGRGWERGGEGGTHLDSPDGELVPDDVEDAEGDGSGGDDGVNHAG